MENKPTILVADDHPLFREGVINFLSSRDYRIKGEAEDGEETLKLLESLSPDILILDINMPKLSGIQVAEQAYKILPDIKIAILTIYKEEKLFNKIMDLGVLGYILKESAVIEILDCLKAILKNNYFISPLLYSFFLKRIRKKEDFESEFQGITVLTDTERKILRLTAQALTSKQISQELFISPRTVDKHREHICTKLNVHGRLNLVKFAIENKHSF